MLALVRSRLGVAACVVVWTMGEMLLLPTASAYADSLARDDNRGRYFGASAASHSVALLAGPAIGLLLHQRMSWPTLWVSALACGTVSAMLLAFIRPAGAARRKLGR